MCWMRQGQTKKKLQWSQEDVVNEWKEKEVEKEKIFQEIQSKWRGATAGAAKKDAIWDKDKKQ